MPSIMVGIGRWGNKAKRLCARTEVSSLKQSNINVTGNVPYPDPYQGRDPATFVSTCFTYLAAAFNSW